MRRKLIPAVFVMLVLTGCGDSSRLGSEACADTKLLRVKVGDAIFAFPSDTINGPMGIIGEKEGGHELIAIANPDPEPDDLRECNRKERPVADFGDWISFTDGSAIDDPSELAKLPERIRRSYQIQNLDFEISRYDPDHRANRHKIYHADVSGIEDIEFVGRVDKARQGSMPGKRADFEFRAGDKTLTLTCTVGYYSDYPDSDAKRGGTDGGGCDAADRRHATFRSGELLISIRTSVISHDGVVVDLSPQDWPKMWAFAAQKALSYRTEDQGRAN